MEMGGGHDRGNPALPASTVECLARESSDGADRFARRAVMGTTGLRIKRLRGYPSRHRQWCGKLTKLNRA